MSAYKLVYIQNEVTLIDDIIGYIIDFKIEQELEKLLDKLTLKISRQIDGLGAFIGFNPDIELYLKFNDVGIFRGRCKTSDKKEWYTVEAYSCAEILDRTIAQKIYEDTTPEAIFTDLINTYTDLTPHTGVSGVSITHLVANDYIGSICKKLNDSLGWSIYTDSEKNIYFEPRGTEENAVIIRRQSSSSNAIFGKWQKDYNEMCNSISVTGSDITISTSESFTGNGVAVAYYLTNAPITINISINGVEQNPNTYKVYPESRKILFENAPGNTLTILIDYNYIYPLYASRSDETSIATYGKFSKILFYNWLTTRYDIITFCNKYLDTYKNPLLSNNIIMNAAYVTIFTPGETVRIVDDIEGYDSYYIINKIKLEYLKGTIELNVGSYIPFFITLQSSMQERIKDLEKSLSKSIAFSHAFGYLSTITSNPSIKSINEFSSTIPITYILDPAVEQNTGTFLVGTARVGFSDVG